MLIHLMLKLIHLVFMLIHLMLKLIYLLYKLIHLTFMLIHLILMLIHLIFKLIHLISNLIHLILIRENCGKRNAKTGRRFYQRPYFVSPAADLSFSNWVLVSSQYTATQFKAVALRYGLGLVAQVHGFNTWKLVAKEPCPHICPPIQLTLNAGEISKQFIFVIKF